MAAFIGRILEFLQARLMIQFIIESHMVEFWLIGIPQKRRPAFCTSRQIVRTYHIRSRAHGNTIGFIDMALGK
jgi:hypothetical protein